MKISELRDRTDNGLEELEQQLEDELFQLEMQHQTGQLQETSRLEETRRDIARIKTILRERELEGEESEDEE
jgi:large subunit ribosomal protein L29